jgi:hypothetical protein
MHSEGIIRISEHQGTKHGASCAGVRACVRAPACVSQRLRRRLGRRSCAAELRSCAQRQYAKLPVDAASLSGLSNPYLEIQNLLRVWSHSVLRVWWDLRGLCVWECEGNQ